MDFPESKDTELDDRRGDSRRWSDAQLRIEIETKDFGGQAENLSQAGVFFFSGDRIRVRVEVVQEGKVRTLAGHLVRVERMSAESTGYAIEFER